MALIGQAGSKEKMFEIVDGRRTPTDDGRMPSMGILYISSKRVDGSLSFGQQSI